MIYRLSFDSEFGPLHLDYRVFQVAMRHLGSLVARGRRANLLPIRRPDCIGFAFEP